MQLIVAKMPSPLDFRFYFRFRYSRGSPYSQRRAIIALANNDRGVFTLGSQYLR